MLVRILEKFIIKKKLSKVVHAFNFYHIFLSRFDIPYRLSFYSYFQTVSYVLLYNSGFSIIGTSAMKYMILILILYLYDIVKNADPDKCGYSVYGIGFDAPSQVYRHWVDGVKNLLFLV